MHARLTLALAAALMLAGCQHGPVLSTERPLFAEDYTPAQINTRVAHLLDVDARPLPPIRRLEWETWDAREDTQRSQHSQTIALYDPNQPAILLSPAANDSSIAHELAHHYGAGERGAACVGDNWHADMPRGWCS